MDTKTEFKFNIDESMNRLREICRKLNDETTSLEETVELYKEGISLSDSCLKNIESIRASLRENGEDNG